jgi:hypothetical protein
MFPYRGLITLRLFLNGVVDLSEFAGFYDLLKTGMWISEYQVVVNGEDR